MAKKRENTKMLGLIITTKMEAQLVALGKPHRLTKSAVARMCMERGMKSLESDLKVEGAK